MENEMDKLKIYRQNIDSKDRTRKPFVVAY